MATQRVLICGAGVAGCIAAFWLGKHGYEVVVIERSRAAQKAGQGIEIEEPALKVVKAMGILDKLNARKTGEEGFELVDQSSRSWGILKTGRVSFTGALELMRGELVEVLYRAADELPNVTFRFETTISGLSQTQDKVIVDMENRKENTKVPEEFDLAVGADGVNSRTRHFAMGSPEKLNCFKPVGAYSTYFSIPKEDHDWPYSRACHFPGRRVIWLRPVAKDADVTSAYLITLKNDVPKLRQASALGDRKMQKEAVAEVYRGLGWEAPRVIEQMMKAENFYSDELKQVKLKSWSEHRVVLLGDAAWAPTPFTGQGNQFAIIGAWVLAQEMSRNRSPKAFVAYETRLRPYVDTLQQIPLWGYAPYLFCPQTNWGIAIWRIIFRIATWLVFIFSGVKTSTGSQDYIENDFDLQIDEYLPKTKP